MAKSVSQCRWLIIPLLLLFSAVASASELIDRAKAEIERGSYAQAAQMLHEEIKQDGSDYQLWFLLGVAYARQQQFHQAVEAFRQVIELNPELAEPHNNLAVIYNELGDVHAAVDELEMSLQKQPGYAVAEENLAELYLKLAMRYYKSALEKSPTPQIQQRYTRLLHVRDPLDNSQSAKGGSKAASEPVAPAVAEAAARPQASADEQREIAEVDSAPVEKAVSFDEASVLAAVEAWRAAWSAQDLEGYFASYADDYMAPARFGSIEQWKAYKRRVISGKKYIQVELRDIEVKFAPDQNRVIVRFAQSFHSDTFNGDDNKELELERQGPEWKISREDTVS